MVEQWTENPCVGSSILPSTTFNPLADTCKGFFVPKFVPATLKKPRILNESRAICVGALVSVYANIEKRRDFDKTMK